MSVVAPAGMIAAAVLSAGRGTAGEEEDGALGLLLGAPVGRVPFLLAKAVAMAIHVLVVCGLLALGLVAGNAVGDLGLTAAGIVGATVHPGCSASSSALWPSSSMLASGTGGGPRSSRRGRPPARSPSVPCFRSRTLADGARFAHVVAALDDRKDER
ncbi:hypothetical protein [Streptomyces poriticola]|uniref:hypothetical protein n=1 Tax=Streptomyces poriticola TaxID=3120506 RepID=UPI002FCE2015